MMSEVLVCYFTVLFFGNIAQIATLKLSPSNGQENGFVSAKISEKLTLECFHQGDVHARLYWYKQALGQVPRLMSTYHIYGENDSFHGEFQNNLRFSLDTKKGKNHLIITDLQLSDSATYYCLSSYLYTLAFLQSITVSVSGPNVNIPTLVQRSTSESIHPGGSVTLSCTVYTGTCDEEQSVFWFKSSNDSHPGLIYTDGGRQDKCEKKHDKETHACIYSLMLQNLDLHHTGTYYCAVASCGHIVFGNGTKLDFDYDYVLYLWRAGFGFTSILSVLLALSLCIMSKRRSLQSTESQARLLSLNTTKAKGGQLPGNLYFAALTVNLAKKTRRQWDNSWTECVYNNIK
ncbi:uncharacterized protein KZ484_009096 [Pholidichthys leucotaenia]